MTKFQVFVLSSEEDFDPNAESYVCVPSRDDDGLVTRQLSIYEYALSNATAPFVGVATSHCLLDFSAVVDDTASSWEAEIDSFENVSVPLLKEMGYFNGELRDGSIDIVVPERSSWLNCSLMSPVDRHVMWYWWHRRKDDFSTLRSVFVDLSPNYLDDLEEYQLDETGFPLGAFAMRANLFKEFVSWATAIVQGFLLKKPIDENSSWVESLAPRIMMLHLLAIFLGRQRRIYGDERIMHVRAVYFERMSNPYLKPAFPHDNIAVALSTDAAYAPLASVVIESILRNSSDDKNYDIVVFDAGLSRADCEFFLSQVSSCDNVSLRFIRIRQILDSYRLREFAHISTAMYARFFILEFMKAYRKVVYLDSDLVCEADVSELFDVDVSGYLVAAVRDTADAGWSNIVDNDCRRYIKEVVSLENPYDYFNSGVLLLNIEEMLRVTSCAALLNASLEKRWRWVDQDVLNHVCAGKVKYLNQAWNYMAHKESYFIPETLPEVWLPVWLQDEYRRAHFDPKIIHYVGRSTPCFSPYSDSAWVFWKYAKTSPYYEILLNISAKEFYLAQFNPIEEAKVLRKPLVSIVMPVYNAELYLDESIGSLLAQTYKKLEIICVNDGSTDCSLEVLRRYAAEDSRVIVVDRENSGAGSTRNAGMEYVNGKYMCFVDSDDFLEGHAIERLVEISEANNTDAVIFDIDQYDNMTGTFSPNTWAVSRSHIRPKRVFNAANVPNFYKHLVGFTVNKFYRTSFLMGLNLRFPKIGAHEDMPFTYIALSAAEKLYYLDETLYHYRRSREGSLSDSTDVQYGYMFDALDCLREGLSSRGLWDTYERLFVNYVLHMCIWKHGELGKVRRLEFRDSCRTKWFTYFGLDGYPSEYFFEGYDYDFVESTVNMPNSRIIAAKICRLMIAESLD